MTSITTGTMSIPQKATIYEQGQVDDAIIYSIHLFHVKIGVVNINSIIDVTILRSEILNYNSHPAVYEVVCITIHTDHPFDAYDEISSSTREISYTDFTATS